MKVDTFLENQSTQTPASGGESAFGSALDLRDVGRQEPLLTGRQCLEKYLGTRESADLLQLQDEALLEEIHLETEKWILESDFYAEPLNYEDYSRDVVEQKMLGLADFLKSKYPDVIKPDIFTATEQFIDTAFTMYDEWKRLPDGEKSHEVDGSFAFVVPMRVTRFREDYGNEVEKISPVLRYIPNKYRALFAVGLPPLILDRYAADAQGNRGYLVLAPVYGDMMADLPLDKAEEVANQNINDAVDFAHQMLGADIVGLGAVLPAITRFGASIKNPNVITTTGHGGTTHLIVETIEKAIEQGYTDSEAKESIGVLGLGSIGASIAELVADRYPESKIIIFDSKEAKRRRVLNKLAVFAVNVTEAQSDVELIRDSRVIISAIVGQVSVSSCDELNDLRRKLFVDDSQPGSFSAEEIESRGGVLAWVIGKDETGRIRRSGYDYGSMSDKEIDLFGCEGEAAVLSLLKTDLEVAGHDKDFIDATLRDIALSAPVTPDKARRIGELFNLYGIVPSNLQRFGKPAPKPQKS